MAHTCWFLVSVMASLVLITCDDIGSNRDVGVDTVANGDGDLYGGRDASTDGYAELDSDVNVDADDERDSDTQADADRDDDIDRGEVCSPGCAGGACLPGDWATICPGTFSMGSPPGELGRERHEEQHLVTLTRGFEILSTEVSQAEFEAVMGLMPGAFAACGGDCPVNNVSWHEAAAYCNALSELEGHEPCFLCVGSGEEVECGLRTAYVAPYECEGYRLPTEAEWEYATRAGTTTAFYSGDHNGVGESDPTLELIGWYFGNSEVSYEGCADLTWKGGGPCAGINPRALKEPNPWGLFDVSGNVFEWVWDRYDSYDGVAVDPVVLVGDAHVARGGGWMG